MHLLRKSPNSRVHLSRRSLALVLAMLLAGCRTSAATQQLNIALAVFPDEAARYEAFVTDFESQHHVHVNVLAQTYTDILQAMRVQAASHGSLDLVELDLAMLGEAHGYAQPLDTIVSPSARALFSNEAWNAATIDRHLYFIPHRLMWQAMIYNRIAVPNPPANWNDLARFAREHPGKLALKGARYEGVVCDVMPFVWTAGGDQCAPDSPNSLRALDFLRTLAPDLNDESAVFREMSVLEAQARGSVWIHFNWPFAIAYLHSKGLAPSVNLSAPIPAGPDGRATPLGGGYLAIPNSAPHEKLAAEFMQYLLTADVQAKLSRELGWYGSVPPPVGSEDAQLYAGYVAMRPFVRARPTVDCYADLSDQWRRAIRAVLFDNVAPASAIASDVLNAADRCDCAQSSSRSEL
jgi:arabinogalactan oligomer / maltooligosaccharide transport system substrate-binding protein